MNKSYRFLFITITLVLTGFMIICPRETVLAASFGFQLWYTTVLPALFPFFIVAELLVSLRLVNLLGIWLEPIMRPVFRLPGCSSLVLVMGFTSGFPVGAILTRKLYENKMLTANEAERLVSFTNNSSPLFIVGAVGVGMLANPAAGYLLAAAHYLSNLLIGFLWRFKAEPIQLSKKSPPTYSGKNPVTLIHLEETQENLEGIGKILGDAIRNAVNNVLAVGGFIVIFSVLARMLSFWGFLDLMATGLTKICGFLPLSYPLAYGLSMGFFEITMGAKTAVAASDPGALATLLVVTAILAFSGLSIISQVMSVVAGIPVRLSFYLQTRALQVLLSLAIAGLIYRFFLGESIHTMGWAALPLYKILYSFNAWTFSLYSMLLGFIIILFMLGLAWCRRT